MFLTLTGRKKTKKKKKIEIVTIILSETVVFVRCCKVSEIKVAQPLLDELL